MYLLLPVKNVIYDFNEQRFSFLTSLKNGMSKDTRLVEKKDNVYSGD